MFTAYELAGVFTNLAAGMMGACGLGACACVGAAWRGNLVTGPLRCAERVSGGRGGPVDAKGVPPSHSTPAH